MNTFDILFYVFAVVAVVSAGIVVFSRNVLYAAFSLVFTLFSIAALYAMLQADFLAVTQVLIYVGGILVLMLFGLMLTNRVISVDIKSGSIQIIPALILAAMVAGSLAGIFYSTWSASPTVPASITATTPNLGTMLMTTYLLPFEVASVVLLIALIGAAMLARRQRKA
jgi:NADH-quinone oxidoreductase subunit J